MDSPGRKKPAAPQGDGLITSLTVRRNRADRTVVCLEGGSEFELASVLVEKAGLRAGFLLGAEERERLVREDEPYRALSRALHLLAARDRSRREVERRLKEIGFDEEVIAETTAWLEGLGYLDDARFAQHYAAEKLRMGWGPRRISAELARKGVERGLVDDALDAEGDNAQAALEGNEALLGLLRRRFGAQFAADADAAERRLAGYLTRRGYDWETVARMARELRAGAGGEGTLP